MASIIVKSGDPEDVGKVFTLDKPALIIGRRTSQNKPDIELNDEVASRRHIEVVLKDGKYWIRDLGSTNGTMLNDDRIFADNLYELRHNSRIGLGVEGDSAHTMLVFKESEGTNIIQSKDSSSGKPSYGTSLAWLKIDEEKKEVVIDGKRKKLSKKEYELMRFLYKNAGTICTRGEISEAIWTESKDPSAVSNAAIDQLVHRLREKVEPQPAIPSRIISKKAFGYMLV